MRQPCPAPDSQTWDRLAEVIRNARHGLIVCGPQNSTDDLGLTVARLAEESGFPVVADVASQLRFGSSLGATVCSHFDLFLRNRSLAQQLVPDLVLRIGGLPTSKTLNLWFGDIPSSDHILVDDQPEIADPYRYATQRIVSPLDLLATELVGRLEGSDEHPGEFARRWCEADERATALLDRLRETRDVCFEGDVVRAVFENAPSAITVYLSNSMPIRLADTYARASARHVRVLCNRGANGIDGIVSSAVGAAIGAEEPLVLVTGDLALLHDINGLLGARLYDANLKVVVLNNDGGGIFSFLPIAEHEGIVEPLVIMPHGRTFADAARFNDIPYSSFSDVGGFTDGYRESLGGYGPEILEIQTDRRQTLNVSNEIYQHFAELG
jgi:2-succinyl-5-enolpyruvyl-6-hydroxy-3-cyclohexene-1-carboxylate synthase